MRTTDDQKILEMFSFLTENGFELVRDYRKDSDRSCVQLYRFQLNGMNYIEFSVLSEKECTLCVRKNGDYSFPNLYRRYRSFVRRWKWRALFHKELREAWLLDAALLKLEMANTGNLFGLL